MKPEDIAIELIPVYPINRSYLKNMTWVQYIENLRNAFISGLKYREESPIELPNPERGVATEAK